jgi:DNA-binding MarR family transcriptional regulator
VTTISRETVLDTEVLEALRAYGSAVVLAEPLQARLWHSTGITLTQLSVLRQLREAPQPAGRLARAVGLSSASATRLLDRLEENGLISRRRGTDDRRRVEIDLQPEGRRIVDQTRVLKGSDVDRGVRAMTSQERQRVTGALRLLVERVREQALEAEAVTR